jgi:hypothetical protein
MDAEGGELADEASEVPEGGSVVRGKLDEGGRGEGAEGFTRGDGFDRGLGFAGDAGCEEDAHGAVEGDAFREVVVDEDDGLLAGSGFRIHGTGSEIREPLKVIPVEFAAVVEAEADRRATWLQQTDVVGEEVESGKGAEEGRGGLAGAACTDEEGGAIGESDAPGMEQSEADRGSPPFEGREQREAVVDVGEMAGVGKEPRSAAGIRIKEVDAIGGRGTSESEPAAVRRRGQACARGEAGEGPGRGWEWNPCGGLIPGNEVEPQGTTRACRGNQVGEGGGEGCVERAAG